MGATDPGVDGVDYVRADGVADLLGVTHGDDESGLFVLLGAGRLGLRLLRGFEHCSRLRAALHLQALRVV